MIQNILYEAFDMKTKILEKVFKLKFAGFLFIGVLGCGGINLPALAAMPIQQWTTANGAKVLFVETHAIPVLDISVNSMRVLVVTGRQDWSGSTRQWLAG